MRLTCTVLAALKGTLDEHLLPPEQQMLIFLLTLNTHWTTFCSLKRTQTHTSWIAVGQDIIYLKMWVLTERNLVPQSHITAADARMNSFCCENETIPGWQPWKKYFQGLKVDKIHRNSWWGFSVAEYQPLSLVCGCILRNGWMLAVTQLESGWVQWVTLCFGMLHIKAFLLIFYENSCE